MSPSTDAAAGPAKPTLRRRGAGLLLHVTSLPGGQGVGDLGPQAYLFADFLADSGLRWWQMLPVVPAGAGFSPYSSPSAFAGNPLLISLELLAQEGLLDAEDAQADFPEGRADFEAAAAFKEARLRKASARFAERGETAMWEEFRSFFAEHSSWLDDWGLFCALKERLGGASWTQWPEELRRRDFRRWDQELLKGLGQAAFHHQFVQFVFQRQWRRLRAHCAVRGVGLIGDVPIFVAHESADVWSHQDLFELGEDGRPTVVAGVPPDYFSRTGQRWGNPHYRWDVLKARGYDWWLARLRCAAERFDAVRLDHFIGFQNYWEIPASSATAQRGRWVAGPGADFFARVERELPRLELIAEDLGSITPEVTALRDQFDLPGMRVLQFAFGSDNQAESFLPRNYPRRCVAYTGTHDNDTVVGWYNDDGKAPGARAPEQIERERHNARVYLSSDGRQIHWDMIGAVMRSTADTAIVPVQDILGLSAEARMKRPGTASGNWDWRLRAGELTPELSRRLKALAEESGRI